MGKEKENEGKVYAPPMAQCTYIEPQSLIAESPSSISDLLPWSEWDSDED